MRLTRVACGPVLSAWRVSMSNAIKHAEDCACRECKLQRNEPRTETCDCCGKRRLCKKVSADKLTRKLVSWSPDYCLKECFALSETERGVRCKQAREERRSRVVYPIIGGPLDGQYAIPDDFSRYGEGKFADFSASYATYNSAGRNRRDTSMIFLYVGLLQPTRREKR